MAYDAPNGFRAEVRDAVGGLKGVYGWRDQEGKLVTKTFMNDEKGFRYYCNFVKLSKNIFME